MAAEQLNEQAFRKLKRDVEEAHSAAEQARGALNQLLRDLKAQFKCSTVEEAQTLLEELESKQAKAERKFESALKDYQKKWSVE